MLHHWDNMFTSIHIQSDTDSDTHSENGGAGALVAWASTAWSPWKGRLGEMN